MTNDDANVPLTQEEFDVIQALAVELSEMPRQGWDRHAERVAEILDTFALHSEKVQEYIRRQQQLPPQDDERDA